MEAAQPRCETEAPLQEGSHCQFFDRLFPLLDGQQRIGALLLPQLMDRLGRGVAAEVTGGPMEAHLISLRGTLISLLSESKRSFPLSLLRICAL